MATRPKAKAKPKAKPKAKRKYKPTGKPVGRPTKLTPTVVAKLEQAFLMGCTDEEACLFADISKKALYNYQDKNPEFVHRKEVLKSNPVMLSRQVVLDALEDESKDSIDRRLAQANKVLDRKEGSKLALTGPQGGPIQTQSITTEMTPEDAGRIYADFFKRD